MLVGCSRTKLSAPAPARDLFQGPGFRRARAHAVASGAPWFVLSAKYGLEPVGAVLRARIERETEMRQRFERVHVCHRVVRELRP